MKKTILALSLFGICSIPASSFGAATIAFDDLGAGGLTATSGTFASTATFTLNVNLTYSGFSALGLSYYLEAPALLAPNLSITGISYSTSTFTDPNTTISNPETFTQVSGSATGDLSNSHDLGATVNSTAIAAGTYTIAQITFALTNATAGTYTLETTTAAPKASSVGDSAFGDNAIPASQYTITVVPEPSAFVLGGLGLAALLGMRNRRSS